MIKNHYFMGYLIKFVFFLNRWFFAMYVLVLFLYLILFLLRVTFLLHCQIFVEIFIVWSLYLYIISFQKRRPLSLECPQVHPQWGGMVGPVYSFHRCGFRRFRASAKTALSGSCRLLESHTTFSFFFRSFFLCPSLWSIHLDVFHRVTNDSMALAFFFIQFSFPGWKESCSLDSPVVSCVLGRRAVAQCMEQHRALCAIPTIVFLFFFFLFFHLSTASLLFRTRWLCWSSCSFAKICPTLIRSQTHNGCPFSGSSVAMESIALRPDFLLIRLLSFSRSFVSLFLLFCNSLEAYWDYPAVCFLFGFNVPFFDLHTSISIF